MIHHRGLSCTWTCLHYSGLCCTWRCLRHKCLSRTWTYLDKRSLCCSWTSVSTLLYTVQGPELHLDVSGQQKPLLLLGVSTLLGSGLHLDVLDNRSFCCPWMSIPQGHELHLGLFGLQKPKLLHGSLRHRGLSRNWVYLDKS
jgi:hypothetical protein